MNRNKEDTVILSVGVNLYTYRLSTSVWGVLCGTEPIKSFSVTCLIINGPLTHISLIGDNVRTEVVVDCTGRLTWDLMQLVQLRGRTALGMLK